MKKICSRKIMKIAGLVLLAVLLVSSLGACCSSTDGDEIVLSFGGETQKYFSGETELYPIKGEQVADGDAVEKATVVLLASEAIKMQLSMVYDEGYAGIQGLMISINGKDAVSFENNAVLYASESPETRAELKMVIFLKNSPISEKGKTIKFYFKLDEVAE